MFLARLVIFFVLRTGWRGVLCSHECVYLHEISAEFGCLFVQIPARESVCVCERQTDRERERAVEPFIPEEGALQISVECSGGECS